MRSFWNEIEFVIEENTAEQDLDGMTFVITGSLETYPNRDALKKEIEDRGGKVAGSVSAKTSCLINNDINSTSSKNKKAKSLGIPIITVKKCSSGNKQFTKGTEKRLRYINIYIRRKTCRLELTTTCR